jgi:uncharacterized protein YeeX (DUF496 family)
MKPLEILSLIADITGILTAVFAVWSWLRIGKMQKIKFNKKRIALAVELEGLKEDLKHDESAISKIRLLLETLTLNYEEILGNDYAEKAHNAFNIAKMKKIKESAMHELILLIESLIVKLKGEEY